MNYNDWSVSDLQSRYDAIDEQLVELEDEVRDYECEQYLIKMELRNRGELN